MISCLPLMGTSKGYKPGSVLLEGCRSCSGEPKQPVPPSSLCHLSSPTVSRRIVSNLPPDSDGPPFSPAPGSKSLRRAASVYMVLQPAVRTAADIAAGTGGLLHHLFTLAWPVSPVEGEALSCGGCSLLRWHELTPVWQFHQCGALCCPDFPPLPVRPWAPGAAAEPPCLYFSSVYRCAFLGKVTLKRLYLSCMLPSCSLIFAPVWRMEGTKWRRSDRCVGAICGWPDGCNCRSRPSRGQRFRPRLRGCGRCSRNGRNGRSDRRFYPSCC